MTVFSYTET